MKEDLKLVGHRKTHTSPHRQQADRCNSFACIQLSSQARERIIHRTTQAALATFCGDGHAPLVRSVLLSPGCSSARHEPSECRHALHDGLKVVSKKCHCLAAMLEYAAAPTSVAARRGLALHALSSPFTRKVGVMRSGAWLANLGFIVATH